MFAFRHYVNVEISLDLCKSSLRILELYVLLSCQKSIGKSALFPVFGSLASQHVSCIFHCSTETKELSWNKNGTTKDVTWVQLYAEKAVDLVPQLPDKGDSATIQ